MKKNIKEINKKNIVIIFGGKSTEHDISILSYLQAVENIDKQKYQIFPVYISKKGEWFYSKKLEKIESFKNKKYEKFKKVSILPNSDYIFIKKCGHFKPFVKIDCVIPIMHGINGEDGTLQGLLELSSVPFTSCSVFASSVGISKYAQKVFFKSLNLPVIDFFKIEKTDFELKQNDLIKTIKFPVVVKPDKLGSSIGISFCKNKTQLKKALELAFKFDNVVVVEKAIKNLKEVNISVLGNGADCKVSLTEQPLTTSSILTFEDKYLGKKKGKTNITNQNNFKQIENEKHKSNQSQNVISENAQKFGTKSVGMQNIDRIMPANISDKMLKEVEDYAKTIFRELSCKGVVRIDFIVDKNKVFVNEINTIPGSLSYYLWKEKTFGKLLDELIEIATKNWQEKNKLNLIFDSHIIK